MTTSLQLNLSTRRARVIKVADTRTVEGAAQQRIGALRARCRAEILARAPEADQRNAALGLVATAEVEAIKAHIAACRATYADLKARVAEIASGALGSGDVAACAAIEAVVWPAG